MALYRIVRDTYSGYEMQYRTWWWPFWSMPRCNTFRSIELAQEWAEGHACSVVKYLGNLKEKEIVDAK